MKVKCPSCGRISFETTDKFNPDAPPHGGMVRCLLQYQIDWLTSPTTPPSEMCCPECLAPLVVGGVLNVVIPAREAGEEFKDVLTDDQKRIIIDSDIKKEQLKTNVQMVVPEGTTVITEPDDQNIIPGGEPSDLTTPFTSDGNPTPAKEEPESDRQKVPGFFCDVCGKECKNQFGLNSHKKSHKGGK